MNIIHFKNSSGGGGGSYEDAPVINIPYFSTFVTITPNAEIPWDDIEEGLTFETFRNQVISQVSEEHKASILFEEEVVGYNYFGWINDEIDGIKSMCTICDSLNELHDFLSITFLIGAAVFMWTCYEDGVYLSIVGGM